MNHADHVQLLRSGIHPGGIWADFGSGQGAFTLAWPTCWGQAAVHAIDRDPAALRQRALQAQFLHVTVHYRVADFTVQLDLPPRDGIVMANALHFVRQKAPVLRQMCGYLNDGGHLILVEYDTDQGNRWVRDR